MMQAHSHQMSSWSLARDAPVDPLLKLHFYPHYHAFVFISADAQGRSAFHVTHRRTKSPVGVALVSALEAHLFGGLLMVRRAFAGRVTGAETAAHGAAPTRAFVAHST